MYKVKIQAFCVFFSVFGFTCDQFTESEQPATLPAAVVGAADKYHDRLKECGLILDRPIRDDIPFANVARYECWGRCVSDLSCSFLEQALCHPDYDFEDSLDPVDELLYSCEESCAGWRCENGVGDCSGGFTCESGQVIPGLDIECDGTKDCADGSDEYCDEVKSYDEGAFCDDGSKLHASQICNFVVDCADGSDEGIDCPAFTCGERETWECANGQPVRALSMCLGSQLCDDGSDLLECDYFSCSDGKVLVEAKRCDFYPDCADARDELGCEPENCTINVGHCWLGEFQAPQYSGTFSCDNGEIIPRDSKCDGTADCTDNSDELNCPECAEEPCRVSCDGTSGSEILESHRCDGWFDCEHGEDELACPNLKFTCGDGTEIPLGHRCDTLVDCPSGEDEQGCG